MQHLKGRTTTPASVHEFGSKKIHKQKDASGKESHYGVSIALKLAPTDGAMILRVFHKSRSITTQIGAGIAAEERLMVFSSATAGMLLESL